MHTLGTALPRTVWYEFYLTARNPPIGLLVWGPHTFGACPVPGIVIKTFCSAFRTVAGVLTFCGVNNIHPSSWRRWVREAEQTVRETRLPRRHHHALDGLCLFERNADMGLLA